PVRSVKNESGEPGAPGPHSKTALIGRFNFGTTTPALPGFFQIRVAFRDCGLFPPAHQGRRPSRWSLDITMADASQAICERDASQDSARSGGLVRQQVERLLSRAERELGSGSRERVLTGTIPAPPKLARISRSEIAGVPSAANSSSRKVAAATDHNVRLVLG